MIISFFEEFPTKENLDKIKLINFPTKLYIAAKSYKEFEKIKSQIKSKFVKEIIYWPLLEKEEGYWFSAFSNTKAMERILKESKGPIMLDLELPKKRSLILKNLLSFIKNKKLLREFTKKNRVYTAEYFFIGKISGNFFGLSLNPNKYNNKIIKMAYSSMHDYGEKIIKSQLRKFKKLYGDNILIGLGVLSVGILGNEKIITPKLLKRDLKLTKEAGIKEVVLFRLGGLNKKFIDALRP